MSADRNRRKLRLSDVAVWALVFTWAWLLFGPSGVGNSYLQSQWAQLRAALLKKFQWVEVASGTRFTGPADAVPDVVIFTDYECPFCKDADSIFTALGRSRPETAISLRYVVRHTSPPSVEAAILSLCAAKIGEFAAVHPLLFSFATVDADSSTTFRFDQSVGSLVAPETATSLARCLRDPHPVMLERLSADSLIVSRVRLTGSPTFMTKQGEYYGVPELDELEDLLPAARRQ